MQSVEALNHIISESLEASTLRTAKNTHKFWRQFKGRCLKTKSLSWSIRENKTEVNVDKMAVFVQNKICVVSILNLKNVAKQRVSCQRVSKILLSLLKAFSRQFGPRHSKVFAEIVIQIARTIHKHTHRLADIVNS